MRRLAASAMIALLATGCTTPAEPSAAPSVAATATVIERSVKVAVPEGFEPPFLEFADASHGYALFTKPGEARLFRTVDGGQSWAEFANPQPNAAGYQLYVTAPQTIVVLTEPDSWHVSKDSGLTWVKKPYSSNGPLPAEYPDYQNLDLLEGRKPLPGFEESGVVADGQHRLWQVAIEDGHPVTATSNPNAQTFSRVPVPAQPGRAVVHARIAVSPDGLDVWLIADQEQSAAAGRSARMKATGLPLLWREVDGAWVGHPIVGVKEFPQWPYSATPVNGQLMLLATPQGTGYYADRFVLVPGTPKLSWVTALRDGTTAGLTDQPGVIFLNTGSVWVRIHLSRAG